MRSERNPEKPGLTCPKCGGDVYLYGDNIEAAHALCADYCGWEWDTIWDGNPDYAF